MADISARIFISAFDSSEMTLKKKMSILEREQLYMLEILVDSLNLNPKKAVNNKEGGLMVRIGFVDLKPVDVVAKASKVNGRKTRNKENQFSDEICFEGKTCLLVRLPSDLIRSIKSIPLSIEVYWIPYGEDRNPQDDSEHILLCAATAFLPGCFCDRIATAKDKIDGLSKSYTSTKIYTLTDEHGNPCGSISMCLRLSCFGSSIINHLTLREKSFVFQGFPLGWQLPCTKLSDEDIKDEKYKTECDNNKSLLCKILDPTYLKLHNSNDGTEVKSGLTRPKSPPRVSMDQLGFEKLTSAEKLNDRKYRGLIYEIYPDEPTCSCLPTDRSTHPMMCRSGCVRSCCMALRNPDALKHFSSLTTLASTDNFSLKPDEEQNVTYNSMRTRGGEDTDNNYLNNEVLWNEEYTWHRDDINFKNRMIGGSDYGAFSETTTVIYEKDKKIGANALCRPRTADGIKTTDCICPGKVPLSWRTNTSRCVKKPCLGADCMIRAFKEAQEFVDSLGKVPGLVGLGLMDPSESPYFGRDIQRDYAIQEISEKKREYPISLPALPNQCPAPCNTQIGKVSTTSVPYTSIPTVSGRTGVLREEIPTLSKTKVLSVPVKSKKKEDKKEEKPEKRKENFFISASSDTNVGPCGEPKCKSRQKKSKTDRTAIEESQVKVEPTTTIAAKVPSKFVEKERYSKSRAGPSGDRRPVKISKRVMRYIYSIGNSYPGTNYGHKDCISPRFRVPANMGWLWNTSTTLGFKPRIGWKPGAIGRYLNEILKEAKGASPVEDYRTKVIPHTQVITSHPADLRRGKIYKSVSRVSQVKKESEEDAEPPPTLHIHRKDGTYYITMHPIRKKTGEVSQLDEPMKPLQFKIARNKDDASVASSSTASDMEIEFSPPAAVNRYRKRPDVIHVDTQVRQQEILDAYKPTVEAPKKEKVKKEKTKKEKKGKK